MFYKFCLQNPSFKILWPQDFYNEKAHVSGSCIELMRKIHVSGFSTRPMSQDPLQDPCVRISWRSSAEHLRKIHVSELPQDPCFRICLRNLYKHLCKILSQDLLLDPYLAFSRQDPCFIFSKDPCLWTLCRHLRKIHVPGPFMIRSALQDPV